MILVVTATEMEMAPLLGSVMQGESGWDYLVTGVGPLETAVRCSRHLMAHSNELRGVLQFGVGGAYLCGESPMPELLDICLADREILGDLGIACRDSIDYFPEEMSGPLEFALDSALLQRVETAFSHQAIHYHKGPFITVNSASGTTARGNMLRERWQAICENMEGAAVARLCRDYSLPLVELRVISNRVEDYDPRSWRLEEACKIAGYYAGLALKELL